MTPFVSATLWMSAGVLVWTVHFALIYGVTALACARGFAHAVPWVIGIGTAAAAGVSIAIIAACIARRAEFVGWMSAAIAAVALVAIVMEALPVLFIPACV